MRRWRAAPDFFYLLYLLIDDVIKSFLEPSLTHPVMCKRPRRWVWPFAVCTVNNARSWSRCIRAVLTRLSLPQEPIVQTRTKLLWNRWPGETQTFVKINIVCNKKDFNCISLRRDLIVMACDEKQLDRTFSRFQINSTNLQLKCKETVFS